jgi:hypothetical protein
MNEERFEAMEEAGADSSAVSRRFKARRCEGLDEARAEARPLP